MALGISSWKSHFYRVGTAHFSDDTAPVAFDSHRKVIEPWLTAVLQADHVSLLLGNGLSTAVGFAAKAKPASMGIVTFGCPHEDKVLTSAQQTAKAAGRGAANFEDQLRAALTLIAGLTLLQDPAAAAWSAALNRELLALATSVLAAERGIIDAITANAAEGQRARQLLTSFLLTFASRTATRDRLSCFTTNYDRLVEFGCDLIGVRTIDRFVGALEPLFRSSRLDVDLHYNPPGIRGEPRFLEGVLKLSKLHGSLDWRSTGDMIRRVGLPFGAPATHPELPASPLDHVLIYPNPAKDIETAQYPYAELFRDFSAAICRPNAALVTYGYGFGDDHINRIIKDALTIPSTHLVVISYDDAGGRIPNFHDTVGRPAQITMLLGSHFGDLATLVDHYLPKPAIDYISQRQMELLRRRNTIPPDPPASGGGTA
jgi:hypothetical protein